tara:strand:- start:11350 stop:12492 length:1143 start_codon:yes stop_codon:yes gene_type:complete
MEKGFVNFDFSSKELAFSGNWTIWSELQESDMIFEKLQDNHIIKIKLDENTKWDSSFVVILLDILKYAKKNNLIINLDCLPDKIIKLVELSKDDYLSNNISNEQTSTSIENNNNEKSHKSLANRLLSSDPVKKTKKFVEFFGEWVFAHVLFVKGKVRFRSKDYLELVCNSSIDALPIITLISFLSGVVLAYVGLVQLEAFGAEILIANLIGFGILRDMGALMAAIVMAGRTGAAYAAQLGTMNSNDEIDALSSFNINPMHFLVLPRTLALILMMPLLTIYADIIGLIAGAVIACSTTNISVTEYYSQTIYALGVNDFIVGIIKSFAFGFVIALCGCYYGINSGKKAMDVGNSATNTVVASIVYIVIFDAIFTIFFSLVKF